MFINPQVKHILPDGLPQDKWYRVLGNTTVKSTQTNHERRVIRLQIMGEENVHLYSWEVAEKKWVFRGIEIPVEIPVPVELPEIH